MDFTFLTIGIAVLVVTSHGCIKVEVGKRARDTDLHQHLNTLGQKQSLNTILDVDDHFSFQPVRSIHTMQGSTKWRATQTYEGLEVFGAGAVYAVDDNGDIIGDMSGEIFVNIQEDIPDFSACIIDDDRLFLMGKEIAGISVDSVYCLLENSQRIIYIDDYVKASLAYIIDLSDMKPGEPSSPYIIVGACDNTIYRYAERISKIPTVSTGDNTTRSNLLPLKDVPSRRKRQACTNVFGTGGNPKMGNIVYGTYPYCLLITSEGPPCTLESPVVKVIDLHQENSIDVSIAYSYDCNTPDDGINEANSPNLDAYFFMQTIDEVFLSNYGFPPFDFQIPILVHYGMRYENAVWYQNKLIFGDGDTKFYPLVSLDVTAHEAAHGITQYGSGLIYSEQSGGISEAFSDISGEAVEYLSSYRTNDWMTGYDIMKAAGEALRYLDDPTRDGVSISHIDDYTNTVNVHYSSGIYNKAFYELVVTQEVPMVDAYACFLYANKLYWGPNTGFIDGACGVKNAAKDRFVDLSKIDAAFIVVGIDTTCCPLSMNTLPTTITHLTVSNSINSCYAILPRNGIRKILIIKAKSRSCELINIQIKTGCNDLFSSRNTCIRFDLPIYELETFVCFSTDIQVDDVEIVANYHTTIDQESNCPYLSD